MQIARADMMLRPSHQERLTGNSGTSSHIFLPLAYPVACSTQPEAGRNAIESLLSQPGRLGCTLYLMLRGQIAGVLIIAAAILVIALVRADWHVLFPPGWWRW